jgi:hypothetical protein
MGDFHSGPCLEEFGRKEGQGADEPARSTGRSTPSRPDNPAQAVFGHDI